MAGRPKNDNVRVVINLSPELIAKARAIAAHKGWAINYTVEQSLRSVWGLEADLFMDEIAAISINIDDR